MTEPQAPDAGAKNGPDTVTSAKDVTHHRGLVPACHARGPWSVLALGMRAMVAQVTTDPRPPPRTASGRVTRRSSIASWLRSYGILTSRPKSEWRADAGMTLRR